MECKALVPQFKEASRHLLVGAQYLGLPGPQQVLNQGGENFRFKDCARAIKMLADPKCAENDNPHQLSMLVDKCTKNVRAHCDEDSEQLDSCKDLLNVDPKVGDQCAITGIPFVDHGSMCQAAYDASSSYGFGGTNNRNTDHAVDKTDHTDHAVDVLTEGKTPNRNEAIKLGNTDSEDNITAKGLLEKGIIRERIEKEGLMYFLVKLYGYFCLISFIGSIIGNILLLLLLWCSGWRPRHPVLPGQVQCVRLNGQTSHTG